MRSTMDQTPMSFAGLAQWLRAHGPHLALELVVNAALPLLIYDRARQPWGESQALLASMAPPLLWGVATFVSKRRVDAYAVISMSVMALSLAMMLGGGSPRMLLLREHMVTLFVALAFLFSAAIGRPLIYPLARASMARRSAAEADGFHARRHMPELRYTIMVMTLVWGFGLLAGFALSALMVFTLSIKANLALGPVLFYGMMGSLTLWTVLYRRHREALIRSLPAPE